MNRTMKTLVSVNKKMAEDLKIIKSDQKKKPDQLMNYFFEILEEEREKIKKELQIEFDQKLQLVREEFEHKLSELRSDLLSTGRSSLRDGWGQDVSRNSGQSSILKKSVNQESISSKNYFSNDKVSF